MIRKVLSTSVTLSVLPIAAYSDSYSPLEMSTRQKMADYGQCAAALKAIGLPENSARLASDALHYAGKLPTEEDVFWAGNEFWEAFGSTRLHAAPAKGDEGKLFALRVVESRKYETLL